MRDDFAIAAADFPDPFRLLVRESAASTNDELRTLAEKGASEGLVLLAMEQTAGRGRRGAVWYAPAGESLAFSILLRPKEPKALWPRLALAAGLSVAQAVESFGPSAGIKWPNDVWIGRRKVAGILVEAGRDFAIVGIGLNVNSTKFPSEVSEIATSLRIETGMDFPLPDVLTEIIRRFARCSHQIGDDFEIVLDMIRQRCVLTGQQVSLTTSSSPRQGKVLGIASGGGLLLRTENSVEQLLQADELRILD
jgi:BirA family biotin operon repressor/biotin-[acetyl-CoA-carboxylase] ligase